MLELYGCFEWGHNHDVVEMNVDGVWIPRFEAGRFFWSPVPAVARIVIEELRQAR